MEMERGAGALRKALEGEAGLLAESLRVSLERGSCASLQFLCF